MLKKTLVCILCAFLFFNQFLTSAVFSAVSEIQTEPVYDLNISDETSVSDRDLDSIYQKLLINDQNDFPQNETELTVEDHALAYDQDEPALLAAEADTLSAPLDDAKMKLLVTVDTGSFVITDGVLVEYHGAGGEIVIPDMVNEIADAVFRSNTSITGVTFPLGLKKIGNNAFEYSGLTGELILPTSLETIGNYAFSNTKITDLKLQRGLKVIGDYAFYSCTSIRSGLTIPDTVTKIGMAAFYECNFLTGDLIIPDSVTEMGMMAFMGCHNMNGELKISNKLTTISSFAFARCYRLSGTVRIPDAVTSFGDGIFFNANSVKEFIFGTGLSALQSYDGFTGCIGVETLVFNSVTPPAFRLEHFSVFSNLKTIYVPSGSLDAYSSSYERYLPETAKIVPIGFAYDEPYGISLNQNGTYTFPSVNQNYSSAGTKTITVTNIGKNPTGPLTVSLSGSYASAFTLSTSSLGSIDAYGERSFVLSYQSKLLYGLYTATVTVSGANGISVAFNVKLDVGEQLLPGYEIGLGVLGTYTFGKLEEGYTEYKIMPKEVQIANMGAQATGPVQLSLSGSGANAFALSTYSMANIPIQTIYVFYLTPKLGLTQGTYYATCTATGNNGLKASFDIVLIVDPPPAVRISLDVSGTYQFPNLKETYFPETVTPKVVTITNLGNTTGPIVLGRSGDTAAFVVTPGLIPSIDKTGEKATFSIAPVTGLKQGVYIMDLILSSSHGIIYEFRVRFQVDPPPKQSISQSAGSSIVFSGLSQGYSTTESRPVTITNTGEAYTGPLTLSLTGANTGAFSLSSSTLSGIYPGSNTSFSISPRIGLTSGTYTADLNISGLGISSKFSVSVTVISLAPANYGIIISPNTYTFSSLLEGYNTGALSPKSFQISNTGSQATGVLTVSLSGSNAFSISTYNIPSIGAGASSSITVSPLLGLKAGNYTSTLYITGANGLNTACSLSVNILTNNDYSIVLDASGIHTFNPQSTGYLSGALTEKSIKVTNNGTQPTGTLAVSLSGANPSAFNLSGSALANLAANTSSNFTVIPRTGLTAGTYTAVVVVSGANGINADFTVSFTVTSSTSSRIALDTTGLYTFSALSEGYLTADIRSKTVTVTNTSGQPTGVLSISITGNTGVFNLSKTVISSLAAGASSSFVITPRTGLAVGTYNAKLTVSGASGISASFDLRLDINSVAKPQISLIPLPVSKIVIIVASGFASKQELTIRASLNKQPTQTNYDIQEKVITNTSGILTYGLPTSYTGSINWNGRNIVYVNVNGYMASVVI